MRLTSFLVLALFLTVASVNSHNLEEVQSEYARMQLQPSEAIIRLTKMMEKMEGTAEGETAHAAQHDLLYQSQRQANKERCTKLIAKVPEMDRKIASLSRKENYSRQKNL